MESPTPIDRLLTSCGKNTIFNSSNLSKLESPELANTPTRSIGGNAGRNRSHNRRVVLDFVRANETCGRAEIARSCGLSTQAVSNICETLLHDGLLQEDGFRTGVRGKPVMRYRFGGEQAYSIGLELRPDALITAVLTLSGDRIYSNRAELENASPEFAVPLVQAQVELAIHSIDRDRSHLLGVGIVMPLSFGRLNNSAAGQAVLPGWENTDPKTQFETAIGCPVIIEKDATAAAISESVSGVARGLKSFCFLYFGAGLGLGVIADGHAQKGAFGNAGEIGHIITEIGGAACACGNYGCLEKYASRMSVRDHLAKSGISAPTGFDLAGLLKEGNVPLDDWLSTAATNLSKAIGILENLFDPEAVILGGAMPDTVLDDLIARLDLPVGSVANQPNRVSMRVLRGSSGRMTAAIGGAAMVVHKIVTPSPSVYQ